MSKNKNLETDRETGRKTYNVGPSMVSDDLDLKKFKTYSKPPFVKQMELPPGLVFGGKVLGVHKSKVNNKTTFSFLIRRTDGTDHLFPINSVIESALNDRPEKFVGKEIAFRVLAPKKSAKYRKDYFNCEVFVK